MRVFISMAVSYALACLVGGAVAGALIFLPETRLSDYADAALGTLVLSGLRMWGALSLLTAIAAVLPFALVIALLKWGRIANLFAYTLGGAIVSIAGMFVLDWRLIPTEAIIGNWPIIVAGAVAGFTYRLTEKLMLSALPVPVRP